MNWRVDIRNGRRLLVVGPQPAVRADKLHGPEVIISFSRASLLFRVRTDILPCCSIRKLGGGGLVIIIDVPSAPKNRTKKTKKKEKKTILLCPCPSGKRTAFSTVKNVPDNEIIFRHANVGGRRKREIRGGFLFSSSLARRAV